MALNLCKYGGQPKASAPPTVNITTGFLCGLFGATHPLCRLFDIGVPTGGGVKTLLQALYKAIKLLRFLIEAEEAIEIGAEGEIDTIEFCKVYPSDIELEDINYVDVLSALSLFDNGELMRKLAKIVYVTLWSDNCECKGKKDDGDGSDELDPLPLPPIPDPSDKCYYGTLYLRQIITQSNNDKARIALALEQNPEVPFTIRVASTAGDPVLVNGFPHPTWLPPNQPGDAEGCMCFARITGTNVYAWESDVFVDGFPISANNPNSRGYFTKWETLEWCRPPTPPEPEDPLPIFDPDFLENFCDVFPETEACEKCRATEHQEIDVPFQTEYGEEAVITWAVDVVLSEETE